MPATATEVSGSVPARAPIAIPKVAYFALPIVDGTPAISELRVEWANRERSVDRFTTIPEGGAVRVIESSSAGRPGRLEATPPNG